MLAIFFIIKINLFFRRRSQAAFPQPPLRPLAPFGGPLFNGSSFESSDDRHVLAKCEAIQPSKTEAQDVETLVTLVEKTLKLISDKFAEADKSDEEKEKPATEQERLLKGVMRVGLLAKNMLLKTDNEVIQRKILSLSLLLNINLQKKKLYF